MNTKLGLTVLVACVLAACDRGPPKEQPFAETGNLRLVGSSTMAPLVSQLATAFRAKHPGVTVQVESGGSGRGISEARAGKADIGMVSRALTQAERDLNGFSIARDGVSLIVHADNPVRALTAAQISGIFTGRIAAWDGVGGAQAPIEAITRPEGRSSLEVFSQHFKLPPAEIKAFSSAAENADAIKAVAANPKAITFVSVGEAERQAAAGVPIRLLDVDGIAASSENIRNGKYPLSRSLTLVTRTLPSGIPKAFVDFAMSYEAAPIIRKYDFVSYVD